MGEKQKLNMDDLNDVSGGYVQIEKNKRTGQKYVRVYDNETNERILSTPIFGKDAENVGAPSDSEVISMAKQFDLENNAGKSRNR